MAGLLKCKRDRQEEKMPIFLARTKNEVYDEGDGGNSNQAREIVVI